MYQKGVIGCPKYSEGDLVRFRSAFSNGHEIDCEGRVYIVDQYGTFDQHEEPSYDVMVENWKDTGKPCLVKHLRESRLRLVEAQEES